MYRYMYIYTHIPQTTYYLTFACFYRNSIIVKVLFYKMPSSPSNLFLRFIDMDKFSHSSFIFIVVKYSIV